MAIKMETVTRFYDENGVVMAESGKTANIPGIKEIEEEGFRAAFHQMEVTVLEATDDTRQAAVSDPMKEPGKKSGVGSPRGRGGSGKELQDTKRVGRNDDKWTQSDAGFKRHLRRHGFLP